MSDKKKPRPIPTGRAPGGVPPLRLSDTDNPVCQLCRGEMDGKRSLAELGLVVAGVSDLSEAGEGLCLTCRAMKDTYRRQSLAAAPHLASLEGIEVEALGLALRRAFEGVLQAASDQQLGAFAGFVQKGDVQGLTEWVMDLLASAGVVVPLPVGRPKAKG